MPFKKFIRITEGESPTISHAVPSFIVNKTEVPIFGFTDITGNCYTLGNFVSNLSMKDEDRNIYIWVDPLFETNQPAKESDKNFQNDSLLNQATKIAESIMKGYSFNDSTPYIFFGYSHGCTMAALTAGILQQHGKDVRLFLIDGQTPENSKKYFSSNSIESTNDLISIVEYAVRLSWKNHEIPLSLFTDDDKKQIHRLTSPIDIIVKAAKIISDKSNRCFDTVLFEKHIILIKQNIYNIINAPDVTLTSKFKKITTLTTTEMAKKYQSVHGGWENYAEKIRWIDDEFLLAQKHTDLLKIHPENKLVDYLEQFFEKNISISTLFSKQLQVLFNAHFGNSKSISNNQPIEHHVKSTLRSSSEKLPRIDIHVTDPIPGSQPIENNASVKPLNSSSAKILQGIIPKSSKSSLIPKPATNIKSFSSSDSDEEHDSDPEEIFNRQIQFFRKCNKERIIHREQASSAPRQKCS